MTAERRLDKVETFLSPTELVLAWLAEAHAYGGIEAAVQVALAEPGFVPPINRLARAASEGVQARMKGQPREEVNHAANRAVRETLFRFHLVMRINVVGHERLERQLLLNALFSARLSLFMDASRTRRAEPGYPDEIRQLRNLVVGNLADVRAAGEARTQAERRYLAGQAALFPDDQLSWVEQLKTAEVITTLVCRVADQAGQPALPEPDPNAVAGWVAAHVAKVVEPAKVAALEDVDEDWQALRVATSWLRGKSIPAQDPGPAQDQR